MTTSSPRITYAARPDAASDTSELVALARVYSFVLGRAEARQMQDEKKAAPPSGHDARKEFLNGSDATRSIPG